MHDDDHPTDDAATAPDPAVAVRLEAATTLIRDDDKPDAVARQDGAATSADSAAAAPGAAAPALSSPTPTPPLRIVLAFRPRPGEEGAAPAYDVTISADRGKDAACDPYWRSFENLDLHSALDEAAGVVAAAEEQWRFDPLYPRVTPQPGKAATKPPTGGKGKAAPAKQPPAAPTAILPTVAPAAPAPPDVAPRREPPAPSLQRPGAARRGDADEGRRADWRRPTRRARRGRPAAPARETAHQRQEGG